MIARHVLALAPARGVAQASRPVPVALRAVEFHENQGQHSLDWGTTGRRDRRSSESVKVVGLSDPECACRVDKWDCSILRKGSEESP